MNPTANTSHITLASRVTILRILGVPLFIFLMVYYTVALKSGVAEENYRTLALIVFLVVALTDALDGYLARSRHEITRLGRILDPLADKALLLSALIMFTRPSLPDLQPQFPIGFTILVISRDVLIAAGAIIVHGVSGHLEVRPRWTGKVATFLQMVAIAWALARGPYAPFIWCVWITGLFTFASGAQYLVDGIRQLEKPHSANAMAS